MTRVSQTLYAGNVSDDVPRLVVANMWRPSAGVPVQKEAWPMMMMHRLCLTGRRHGDFQYAHERVLENNSVAIRRRRHSVISVREIRQVSFAMTKCLSSANRDQEGNRRHRCQLYTLPTPPIFSAHKGQGTATPRGLHTNVAKPEARASDMERLQSVAAIVAADSVYHASLRPHG
jgi:hypothetical protein